jgi:O-antigen chain-terminating methyltransferase
MQDQVNRKADMRVVDGIQSELDGIFKELSDHKIKILDQQNRLSLLAEESCTWVSKRRTGPDEEDHILDAMYVAFEEEFRGRREEIKEKQRLYLTYIEEAGVRKDDSVLLDLGCGRGEWLELLKENGYAGRGVDVNRGMIRQCKDLGFDIVESEVAEFLKDQKQQCFAAVTGFHIVEHLPLRTLITVLDEALRVLKPGGVVIFETPNPENLIVGACNFYLDPTHRNPIPPPLLKFLLEARGFVKAKIIKLHPYKCFKDGIESSEEVRELKSLFTMEQDYAVIAYKA